MKTCPFCAELAQEQAVVCKHCTRAIEPVPSDGGLPAVLAAIAIAIGLFGIVAVMANDLSGVGLLLFACLLALLARITQAHWHHNRDHRYLALRNLVMKRAASQEP